MSRRLSFAMRLVGVGVFGVAFAGQATQAQELEYKPQAESETLVEETLAGDRSKTVIIKRFRFEPGWVGGRHYHPASVYVYVLDGEFTIETEGEGRQTYSAGQLYKEPLGRVMQGRNLSTSEELEILVFQIGETGKPMMIKAEE